MQPISDQCSARYNRVDLLIRTATDNVHIRSMLIEARLPRSRMYHIQTSNYLIQIYFKIFIIDRIYNIIRDTFSDMRYSDTG